MLKERLKIAVTVTVMVTVTVFSRLTAETIFSQIEIHLQFA